MKVISNQIPPVTTGAVSAGLCGGRRKPESDFSWEEERAEGGETFQQRND